MAYGPSVKSIYYVIFWSIQQRDSVNTVVVKILPHYGMFLTSGLGAPHSVTKTLQNTPIEQKTKWLVLPMLVSEWCCSFIEEQYFCELVWRKSLEEWIKDIYTAWWNRCRFCLWSSEEEGFGLVQNNLRIILSFFLCFSLSGVAADVCN